MLTERAQYKYFTWPWHIVELLSISFDLFIWSFSEVTTVPRLYKHKFNKIYIWYRFGSGTHSSQMSAALNRIPDLFTSQRRCDSRCCSGAAPSWTPARTTQSPEQVTLSHRAVQNTKAVTQVTERLGVYDVNQQRREETSFKPASSVINAESLPPQEPSTSLWGSTWPTNSLGVTHIWWQRERSVTSAALHTFVLLRGFFV